MKKLALLIVFLLAGCIHPVSFDNYQAGGVSNCYITDAGVAVSVAHVAGQSEAQDCLVVPDAKQLEALTLSVTRTAGFKPVTLVGWHITFVPEMISCGEGLVTDGCTMGSETLIHDHSAMIGRYWPELVRHEAGHALKYNAGKDPDVHHWDCPYWERIEGKDYCHHDDELHFYNF